ncbi:MAG: hypothetical protein FJ271_29415 [Planctomycetes bacterium]|nr:hypothetical protein [Planctomycetota bacterium]
MMLLDRLTATLSQRRADVGTSFDALVVGIADGAEWDPDRVVGILDAAGRSVADLTAAVQRFVHRRELAIAVAAGDVEAELAEVRDEREQLQAAFDEEMTRRRAKHDGAVAILRQREVALVAREDIARSAIRELQRTASPELRDRLTAIVNRQLAIVEEKQQASRR